MAPRRPWIWRYRWVLLLKFLAGTTSDGADAWFVGRTQSRFRSADTLLWVSAQEGERGEVGVAAASPPG